MAVSLFVIGLASGLFLPVGVTDIVAGDVDALGELAQWLVSLPRPLVALVIFLRNVIVMGLSFILSPILCLMPVLSLLLNGWVIVIVSAALVRWESLSFVLAGLLPHGIIEIPAYLIGQAAALSSGAAIILALFKKDRRDNLWPILKTNLKYLLLAVILLLPAAVIEVYVTPWVLSMV